MTSVPDHGQGTQQQQQQQQQTPPPLQPPQPDLRRLLAQHPASLRLAGPPPSSTPPPPQQAPPERYLPSAPSSGPPCSPSPSTPLQACDPGDPYMRRDLPGGPPTPTPTSYYRLPPHVAAAYQAAYDCGSVGGGGGNNGGGRTLPPVPGDYLPPHYHPHPHHASYHYQTLSHHPAHHHRTSHSPHHHHHHHPEFNSRRHPVAQPCGYLRHSSRSARLEELLSARGPSPRLPPTPSTPRATPPLQPRALPPNDVIENPMCESRRRACYPSDSAPPRCYQEPSVAQQAPPPPPQQQRCYQQQEPIVPPQQPSRPDSRCSMGSNAGNSNGGATTAGASLPLSWRTAAAAAAVAQQQQQQQTPCTPGTSPSGQATPASPSSSSSPSASATSSTSSASCSSSSCVSSSVASSVQQQQQQVQASSPRAPSPPSPAPVASSPIESTTADTPRVARAMTRTETIKNYIRRGTAEFFGLCDEGDDEERLRLRWLERRKRLAVRKCGALREECPPVAARHAAARQRAAQVAGSRPDVLPTDSPDHPGSSTGSAASEVEPPPRWAEPPVRRKESVARMALSGLGYVITTLTRHRPRATSRSREWSRSYSPATALDASSTSRGGIQQQQPQPQLRLAPFHEEVFFDKSASYLAGEEPAEVTEESIAPPANVDHVTFRAGPEGFAMPNVDETDHRTRSSFPTDRAASWRRSRQEAGAEATSSEVGASRIWSHVLDRALDNSDRRQYGMGLVGRLLRRSMRRSAVERHKRQLDDLEDYRPFFTYWVTTVHVMVMALSLLCYGLGPLGVDLNQRSGLVMVPSLSLQQVDYLEPANFWIGPRAADLIHLGAKFAPCMRKDHRIWRRISTAREKERETACCIRNDDSGCVQSSQAECSIRGLRPTKTISTWKKWSAGDAGPGGRISGSVCGLDPKYCEAPASVAPYEWPDDITKWPICRKPSSVVQRRGVNGVGTQLRRDKTAEHMVCEVIAHPCCIGIHGACSITTREYCEFVRGKFHEEASLCSQVSCLDDVCGMIPFYTPDRPDQFYRLWTSLFLHAGLVHLLLTLVVQLVIMRDVERLTGPLRMAVIYLGSGMGGNLASAIFVPYRAEVGPAGAQFGLLACLVVEVLDVWPLLKRPEQALLKLLAVVALLLLLGLLPWVDNWAHVFGFVFGLLLSSALLPFVTLGSSPYSRHRKRVQIWACLGGAVALFLALVAIFYLVPVLECPLCDLFNCLPLTPQFCAEQDINFGRDEIV